MYAWYWNRKHELLSPRSDTAASQRIQGEMSNSENSFILLCNIDLCTVPAKPTCLEYKRLKIVHQDLVMRLEHSSVFFQELANRKRKEGKHFSQHANWNRLVNTKLLFGMSWHVASQLKVYSPYNQMQSPKDPLWTTCADLSGKEPNDHIWCHFSGTMYFPW